MKRLGNRKWSEPLKGKKKEKLNKIVTSFGVPAVRGIKPDSINTIMARITPEELARRCSPETQAMIDGNLIPEQEQEMRYFSLKIAPSGCVSVYGLSRIPLNLYKNQWIKLSKVMPDIIDFIRLNDQWLKGKKS